MKTLTTLGIQSICVASLLVGSASASADNEYPIDAWYKAKTAMDSSTVGLRRSASEAREKWDAEMNVVYNRLMRRLNKAQQENLRDAQRKWLQFRDAESKSIGAIVATQDGTLAQLAATDGAMELARARVLQLYRYEQALNGF